MSHRVRRASIGDLEKLVAFTLAEAADSEAAAKDPVQVTKGVLAGLEHEETARYWVLEDEEGAVIGSTSVVREWSDWSAGYYWWIQSMYLKPQYRGRGLMKLLLDEVQSTARAEDAVEVRLYVHKDNAPAIRAYRKYGFQDSDYRIMQLTDR